MAYSMIEWEGGATESVAMTTFSGLDFIYAPSKIFWGAAFFPNWLFNKNLLEGRVAVSLMLDMMYGIFFWQGVMMGIRFATEKSTYS